MKQICLCMLICILFIPGCCCFGDGLLGSGPDKLGELYLLITDTTVQINKAQCLNAKKDFTDVNSRAVLLGARTDGPVTWLITYTNGTHDTLEISARSSKMKYTDVKCDDPYVEITLEPAKLTWSTFSEVRVSGNVEWSGHHSFSTYYDTIYARP